MEAAAAHDARRRGDHQDSLQIEMNYFITGTDTGVGKTLVSCALLHGYAAQGKRVAGFKPVAAGVDADGMNDDAKALRAASNVTLSYEQVNPYCLREAIAPHIAAQRAGVTIDIAVIAKFYKQLAEKAEVVIVEGAGGLLVPLNAQQDSADLALQLALPVILVVGMRLGCLNHALLTVEAIAARGLTLSGWVANVLDGDGATRRCQASGAGVPSRRLLPQTAGYAITSDLASVVGSPSRMASSPISNVSKAAMPVLQENIEAMRERIAPPLLGVVPYMAEPDARVAAGHLHLERLEP
jgi:dethiobiotin synthetase